MISGMFWQGEKSRRGQRVGLGPRRFAKPGQGMIGLLSDEEKTRIVLTRIGEKQEEKRASRSNGCHPTPVKSYEP